MNIDLTYIQEVAGDDEDLYNELMTLMLQEMETSWTEFEEYRDNQDFVSMDRVAHTLKNKFAMLKLDQELEEMESIRTRLKKENLSPEDEAYIKNSIFETLKELRKVFPV